MRENPTCGTSRPCEKTARALGLDLQHPLGRLLGNEPFARSLGAAEFSWERNAARYLEIYERLVSRR